jgi:NAD+ diphosphatase
LAYLSYDDVKDYIGNPFSTPEDERLKNYHSKTHQPEPTLVYLGVDEARVPPPSASPGHQIAAKYPGEAYFSIDVTPENQSEMYKKCAEEIMEKAKSRGLDFLTVRIGVSLTEEEAPIVAMARSFTDWNLRNVYCPACGRRTSKKKKSLRCGIDGSFCLGWIEEDLSSFGSC